MDGKVQKAAGATEGKAKGLKVNKGKDKSSSRKIRNVATDDRQKAGSGKLQGKREQSKTVRAVSKTGKVDKEKAVKVRKDTERGIDNKSAKSKTAGKVKASKGQGMNKEISAEQKESAKNVKNTEQRVESGKADASVFQEKTVKTERVERSSISKKDGECFDHKQSTFAEKSEKEEKSKVASTECTGRAGANVIKLFTAVSYRFSQ
jgi:hypothetical protein